MEYVLFGVFILGVSALIFMSKYFPLPNLNKTADDFDAFFYPNKEEIQQDYKAGKLKEIWKRFCAENPKYGLPDKDNYEGLFNSYLDVRKDI